MRFYVRLDGRLIGWVIAAHLDEAHSLACRKFESWEFGVLEVEQRKERKR